MERYRAELFNVERMMLGESMLLDDERNLALWVDIPGGGIFSHWWRTRSCTVCARWTVWGTSSWTSQGRATRW